MKIISALFVSLFLVLFSCKKDTTTSEILEEDKNSSKSADFNDYPEVINGMLSFRDIEHFTSYFDYINRVTTSDFNNETDTMSSDEKLDLIEERLGYSSLRRKINAEWERKNEIG